MPPLLGAIADDFTGATDLAGILVKHGMRTAQMIGVPRQPPPEELDAIVVALKTRTVPPEDATAASEKAAARAVIIVLEEIAIYVQLAE